MLDALANNDLLSTAVAFVLVLIPAVIVHELGHFLAARRVGIAVLEFGIGFPPRIARLFRWGETEFTLNWLPLGGFVRPLGEDLVRPLGEDAVEHDRLELAELEAHGNKRLMTVNEAKPLPRILFMAAGALANFAAAFLLFVVIGLSGIPQDAGGTVELLEIPPDSEFAAAGLRPGDLIEKLNGQMFADSREFFTKLHAENGKAATLTILRPDTGTAEEIETTLATTTLTPEITSYVRILGVAANSPAHLSGLQPGDLISAFNGMSITSANKPTVEVQRLTEQHAGETVTLTLLRGDQELSVTLVPRLDPLPNEGRIGISIWPEFRSLTSGLVFTDGPQQQALVPQPLGGAVEYSAGQISSVLRLLSEVPGRILKGTMTPEEARPISIIGISKIGAQALQRSIQESQPATILHYIGIINILLGLTNLLPLPALDGGRIVFVLLEIVRGRPISPEREGMVHLIGLVFILSIGVLFMLNDILNPLPNVLR